jgi:DNA-binding transcriptional ArsR family regulator
MCLIGKNRENVAEQNETESHGMTVLANDRSLSNLQRRPNLSRLKTYSHPALKDIDLAEVMQALADPCRLAIVRALLAARGRELCCAEIPLRVSKATRSHHFEVLRVAGLISSRCEGTKCLTSLRRREIDRRFPGLLKLVAREG